MLTDVLQPTVEVRGGDAAATGEPDAAQPLTLRIITERRRPVTMSVLPWTGRPAKSAHPPLWVLRHASQHVRDELRRHDESFVDLAGAVRLHLPGVLVDRNDLAPTRVARPETPARNPFSDRNSLIVRTLLEAPADRRWSLQELARASGVSLAAASYAVRALAAMQLVETATAGRAKGIRVPEPMRIVHAWVRAYDWSKNPRLALAAPVGSPRRFLPRLRDALEGRTWALTLQAGASLVAPHAAWDQVHAYVQVEATEDLRALARELQWEPNPAGKLTLMRPYYRRSAWHGVHVIDGFPVVSTLQLLLDLWHDAVRGHEQALHLIQSGKVLSGGDRAKTR